MTTLIERMAKAICREKCAFMGEPPCWSVDGSEGKLSPNCDDPGCLAEARAALEAMVEPTDAMLEDGLKASNAVKLGGAGGQTIENDFLRKTARIRAAHKAMIDRALNEEQGT